LLDDGGRNGPNALLEDAPAIEEQALPCASEVRSGRVDHVDLDAGALYSAIDKGLGVGSACEGEASGEQCNGWNAHGVLRFGLLKELFGKCGVSIVRRTICAPLHLSIKMGILRHPLLRHLIGMTGLSNPASRVGVVDGMARLAASVSKRRLVYGDVPAAPGGNGFSDSFADKVGRWDRSDPLKGF
jgi:hypothetical protein